LSDHAGRADFTWYPRNSIMSGRYADSGEDAGLVKSWLRHRLREESAGPAPPEALLDGIAARALSGERHACELRTVSDVIAEYGVERIGLLKIDVEKSELDLLRGIAASDWPRIRQVVAEVYDDGARLAEALRLLRRHGFRTVVEQDERLRGTPVHMVYASCAN